MKRHAFFRVVLIVIGLGLCLSIAQTSHAITDIYLDNFGELATIEGFQVDILSSATAEVNWTNNFPFDLGPPVAFWNDFSAGSLISGFAGSSPLPLEFGLVGSFDIDTILGGWELTQADSDVLVLGTDYIVLEEGTNYRITNVPIPSAALLLGTGLLVLVGTRRRMRS